MGKLLIILVLVFSVGCQEEYRLLNIRCQQPCYTGPPETKDVGICRSGTPVCENEEIISCEGETLPEDEYCDLIDNDCNGTVDDSVRDEDANTSCGSNIGECYTGLNICTAGEIECIGAKDASEETCNGLDDDCNGFIDDMELLGYCYEGDPEDLYHGECHAGILICVDGIEICDQQQLPTEEVCDNLDNDCDGFIDEDLDEEDEVDIVFILDRSGSMGGHFSSVANASQLFAASFTGVPEFQFALVGIPHDPGTSEVEILLDFTDASTFVSTLATMSTVGGSLEASYDAPYIASNGDLGLSWRGGDTRKYIVLFTDERAQSYISPILTEADVAAELVAEDITFYGFISSSFYSQFDDISDDTGGAIYNLGSSADMEDDLAKIFDDECW